MPSTYYSELVLNKILMKTSASQINPVLNKSVLTNETETNKKARINVVTQLYLASFKMYPYGIFQVIRGSGNSEA